MHNLDRVEAINKAKGNGKIGAIQQHKCLAHILKYAYDPFKKFYISAPDLDGTEGGTDFTSETKNTLDDLSNRSLSGQNALEKVCDHIVSLSPDSAVVFKRILNKDLRCGINIKTINKAIPGLIPLVFDGGSKPPFLLLKTFKPDKAEYPLLVSVKKDGVRAQNKGVLISRQGHKLIGHTHIEDYLQEYNHTFDGELCIPGEIFDVASGLIRNDDPTPNSVYWIFDAPSIEGSKLYRYNWLKENLKEIDCVKLIPQEFIATEIDLYDFYQESLNKGEEGVVVCEPESLYVDGRPGTWTRLVPIKSADCPVVGFYEGKGKHARSLGGIIVDYKGHEVRVGTGFSEKVKKTELNQLVSQIDKKLLTLKSKYLSRYSLSDTTPIWHKIRQFIWDNQNQFLGVVAKLEFKEKTKAGSLRHPRFKSWRFDK